MQVAVVTILAVIALGALYHALFAGMDPLTAFRGKRRTVAAQERGRALARQWIAGVKQRTERHMRFKAHAARLEGALEAYGHRLTNDWGNDPQLTEALAEHWHLLLSGVKSV